MLAGARVVDADALARVALERFAREGQLERALGAEFVQDGRPDVEALATRAFADPSLLRRLERLVHPPVQAALLEALAEFRAGQRPEPLLVLDVALLLEVGLDRRCDVLWYVEISNDLQIERAAQRGIGREQLRQREAFQSPRKRKRARADLVIRNDVPAENLDAQILAGLEVLGVPPRNPTLGEPTL